ncbi:hypothetical protein KXV85_005980, partial [Aspergillus fumigatus]
VLECAGLALVGIDRHHPRSGLAEHGAPLASGRKARAAKPAQAGIVQHLEDVFLADLSSAQVAEQLVAAILHVGVVFDIRRHDRMGLAARCGIEDVGGFCIEHVAMPDFRHRCAVAESDAGRAHDTDAGSGAGLQFTQQLFRAHHCTGQRVADAD